MGFIKPFVCCALILFPFECVLAKEAKQDFFDIGLSSDFRSTDNAKKKSEDVAAIEEIQSIYSADIAGQYHNDWIQLDSRYDASKSIYNEKSQPNIDIVEGTSKVLLGGEHQLLNVMLSHSQMSLLNSPEALDLSSNRDTRKIISVIPSVKMHPSAADLVVLAGNYDKTSYQENTQLASERKGYTGSWTRGLGKVENLQITIQQLDSTFDFFSSADYQLERASVQLDVKLHNLSYMIQVGYNKATREIGNYSFSSPEYKFFSTYLSGANEFKTEISQAITDSSYGNGNRSGLGGAKDLDIRDTSALILDLIKEQRIELSWRTSIACERCSIGVNLVRLKRDFQKLPQDNIESAASADFKYRFSRSLSFYLQGRRSKYESDFSEAGSGYKQNSGKIGFRYMFTKDFNVEVYTENYKRTSNLLAQSYKEGILGLSLVYHF